MDLDEDLLLLAAGSEDEKEVSYSEEEEAEEEEEEEDYYEEKSVSSRKKRKIASDDEDDDDGLKNPYPLEGKYKDEADREDIMKMDDLQRELILFERSQELERFQERKYLELRAKTDKLNQEERLRSKKKGKSTTKADKREQLRQQRRRAQNKRRGYQDDDEDEDEGDSEDEEEDDYIVEDDEYDYGFAELKESREPEKETTLSDLNNIFIGRQLFAKYSLYPEFRDTVSRCYAKVNVGVNKSTGQPEYRMVQINDIVERKDKPYTLVNRKTNLYVVVTIGKSERTVPMKIFSDRPISSLELKIYQERLLKDNLEILSLRQISTKYYELRDMARRVLTDKEITDMIAKREELESDVAGVNIIMKKKSIQQQRVIALENQDFETAEKLEKELQNIDNEVSQARKTEESVLARVNERNKKLNQELIRKAELKAIELKLKDQNKDDPFSRLKTRTKMFYTGSSSDKSLKPESKEEELERLRKEKEEQEVIEKQRLHSKFRDYYNGLDEVVKSIDLAIDIDI